MRFPARTIDVTRDAESAPRAGPLNEVRPAPEGAGVAPTRSQTTSAVAVCAPSVDCPRSALPGSLRVLGGFAVDRVGSGLQHRAVPLKGLAEAGLERHDWIVAEGVAGE